jgi:hypothetical protein
LLEAIALQQYQRNDQAHIRRVFERPNPYDRSEPPNGSIPRNCEVAVLEEGHTSGNESTPYHRFALTFLLMEDPIDLKNPVLCGQEGLASGVGNEPPVLGGTVDPADTLEPF